MLGRMVMNAVKNRKEFLPRFLANFIKSFLRARHIMIFSSLSESLGVGAASSIRRELTTDILLLKRDSSSSLLSDKG